MKPRTIQKNVTGDSSFDVDASQVGADTLLGTLDEYASAFDVTGFNYLESRVSPLIIYTDCSRPNRKVSGRDGRYRGHRKRQATRTASLQTMEYDQSHYAGLVESSEVTTHV